MLLCPPLDCPPDSPPCGPGFSRIPSPVVGGGVPLMPMGASALPETIGRYAIFGKIASGGMASVHFGRLVGAAGFSRTVAIKRLHPHLADEPEFLSTLIDE